MLHSWPSLLRHKQVRCLLTVFKPYWEWGRGGLGDVKNPGAAAGPVDRLLLCCCLCLPIAARGAGSSCHLHISLHGDGGCNLFGGSQQLGGVQGVSPLFRHFLAGAMAFAPDVLPFYAPTTNSYKRFVGGSWAPTATAWGKVQGDGRWVIVVRYEGQCHQAYLE